MLEGIYVYLLSPLFLIALFLILKIDRADLRSIDAIISVLGFIFGICLIFLNITHSNNNFTIVLGPLAVLLCLLFLSLRNYLPFLDPGSILKNSGSVESIKVNDIYLTISIYILILTAILSYYHSVCYNRPVEFFIIISLITSLIILRILNLSAISRRKLFEIILEIILLSLLFRGSGYFVCPSPLGSDSWAHIEYINYFIGFGHLIVPSSSLDNYYCGFPIAHLISCAGILLSDLDGKQSMYLWSIIIVFSTIFVFLCVNEISKNIKLALMALVLINFADFHIEWGIDVIAMSVGISFYTISIYLFIKNCITRDLSHSFLSIILAITLVFTHTISGFVFLITIMLLYFGIKIYPFIYHVTDLKAYAPMLGFVFLFAIVMIYHWMSPTYPVFDFLLSNLEESLNKESRFLVSMTETSYKNDWRNILEIIQFSIFIFFGFFGALLTLIKSKTDSLKFSMVFSSFSLFMIMFLSAGIGLNNLLPYRWPAFIYIIFIYFVPVGLVAICYIITKGYTFKYLVISILFVSSFCGTTDYLSNMDSPIYAQDLIQPIFWTESELSLFSKINNTTDNIITSDLQTINRPFNNGLLCKRHTPFIASPDGSIDRSILRNKTIIYRSNSLTKPIQISGYGNPSRILGLEFKDYLDNTFSCVFDTGMAKAYET